jgi:hypothetical protein
MDQRTDIHRSDSIVESILRACTRQLQILCFHNVNGDTEDFARVVERMLNSCMVTTTHNPEKTAMQIVCSPKGLFYMTVPAR